MGLSRPHGMSQNSGHRGLVLKRFRLLGRSDLGGSVLNSDFGANLGNPKKPRLLSNDAGTSSMRNGAIHVL